MNMFRRLSQKVVKTVKFGESDVDFNVYKLTNKTILEGAQLLKVASKALSALFDNRKHDQEVHSHVGADGMHSISQMPVAMDVLEMRNRRRDSAIESLSSLLEIQSMPRILASALRETFRDELADVQDDSEVLGSFTVDDMAKALEIIVEVNGFLGKLKGLGLLEKVKAMNEG